MENQKALYNYHPVRSGNRYKIVESGVDFYKVKARGSLYIVPSWVFYQEDKSEKKKQKRNTSKYKRERGNRR